MQILSKLSLFLFIVLGVNSYGQNVSGQIDGHDYVDLGLPSGTLWATCNVGTSKPTENGDYFAWGETNPKIDYSLSTYKWSNGEKDCETKYSYKNKCGIVDKKTILTSEDDAATANWGPSWRMPTMDEEMELLEGCDWEWTSDFKETGVAGDIGISKSNGCMIFLPAPGKYYGQIFEYKGDIGYYWSSTLNIGYNSTNAMNIINGDLYIDLSNTERYMGLSVRAVVKE